METHEEKTAENPAQSVQAVFDKYKIIYKVIFAVTVLRLIWNFLYGFRWPSVWATLYHVFTYDYGFIPRGLVSSILKVFVGNRIYDLRFLYVLIVGTGLVILGFFIYLSYYFNIRKNDIVGSIIVLWYSLSIYSAYLSHEMGYLEQYGYVILLGVLFVLPVHFKHPAAYSIYYAVSILVMLLISEANAFLVCPVLLAATVYRIFEYAEDTAGGLTGRAGRKRLRAGLLTAVCINLPNLLYSIWAGIFSVPEERVSKLVALIRNNNPVLNDRLEEMALFFSQGRARQSFVFSVNFAVWPWQLTCYLLLVGLLVTVVLAAAGRYGKAFFYAAAHGCIVLCAYMANFACGDWERNKFAAAMMVTFFALWMLKEEPVKKPVRNKDIFYIMLIGTMIVIAIMDYRLGLFDGAVYNTSLRQFMATLESTWRIH